MILKVYEQKYGERLRHVKEIVLHQCVECEDFMLLDYVAIRNHLSLRNKNHCKPFSEYFAEVLSETDKGAAKKVKTPEGKDLKIENMDTEPSDDVFNCLECSKSFHYKQYFLIHMQKHKNGLPMGEEHVNAKSRNDPQGTHTIRWQSVVC